MPASLERVMTSLYEAAVLRDLWPDALQQFAELHGSRGALITRGDRNHEGLLCSPGLNPTVAQFFEQGWHYRDYRTDKCLPLVSQGFVADQHIIAADALAASDYYAGFARSAGVPWFASGGIVRADGVCIAISLQRSDEDGTFSGSEITRLNHMHGSLCDVLALGYRMSAVRHGEALRGLELVDRAAVLLDWRGRVRKMNVAADRLIGEVVTVRDCQLRPVDRAQRAAFSGWVDSVISPRDVVAAVRRTMRLEDRHGRAWLAQAMPIAGQAQDVFESGAAIIILSPAHAARGPDRTVLAAAFGLTSAEARVAEQIARGATVDAAAEALAMTRNAVRFHLKSILPKAQVDRQSGFVAAAAALATGGLGDA